MASRARSLKRQPKRRGGVAGGGAWVSGEGGKGGGVGLSATVLPPGSRVLFETKRSSVPAKGIMHRTPGRRQGIAHGLDGRRPSWFPIRARGERLPTSVVITLDGARR